MKLLRSQPDHYQVDHSMLELSRLPEHQQLPLLISPKNDAPIETQLTSIHHLAEERLYEEGGILLRGFNLLGEDAFQNFARSFGHELLSYDFASTPRNKLDRGVYTTTEYPAHQVIPLHNEQAYTLSWPMKIWFHCITEAETGGETPIADSRKIYDLIDPAIRERFTNKKLMYVRNYGGGLDLSWQQTFNTDSQQQVESFCRSQKIDFEWKKNGELRTRQVCQGTAIHPVTGENVWFNQAHLFHISNLAAATRDILLSVVDVEDLPRNVYYGDGSMIEESILDEVRAAIDQCTVSFPWKSGDVLMLDNMLVAHGRSTFTGERKVIVSMAQANA